MLYSGKFIFLLGAGEITVVRVSFAGACHCLKRFKKQCHGQSSSNTRIESRELAERQGAQW
ncbi:hypothetical protein Lpp229_04273 [Lacticaseibacillus paracasei subsp. paracasei Lpp229]|nr:hypothetical protein Lpp229_04273 [Lacticaseibacillus paracasei subsp. paracasei Lpp229]